MSDKKIEQYGSWEKYHGENMFSSVLSNFRFRRIRDKAAAAVGSIPQKGFLSFLPQLYTFSHNHLHASQLKTKRPTVHRLIQNEKNQTLWPLNRCSGVSPPSDCMNDTPTFSNPSSNPERNPDRYSRMTGVR
jgi:hypothetical protein